MLKRQAGQEYKKYYVPKYCHFIAEEQLEQSQDNQC